MTAKKTTNKTADKHKTAVENTKANVTGDQPANLDQPTERAEGGEIIGDNAPPQHQFGKEVPYATAHRFEIEADGKKGGQGPVEGYYFKGTDAEQQAKDYVEANPVDGSYWTVSTGSTAEALDPVDAG